MNVNGIFLKLYFARILEVPVKLECQSLQEMNFPPSHFFPFIPPEEGIVFITTRQTS